MKFDNSTPRESPYQAVQIYVQTLSSRCKTLPSRLTAAQTVHLILAVSQALQPGHQRAPAGRSSREETVGMHDGVHLPAKYRI